MKIDISTPDQIIYTDKMWIIRIEYNPSDIQTINCYDWKEVLMWKAIKELSK